MDQTRVVGTDVIGGNPCWSTANPCRGCASGADRIVYLDEGRIVETGSPDELMAKPDGAYRRFVEVQIGTAA
ncbi:MAG: hypothetical protein OXQ90_18845 [Gammaproteobacteria bacterium]|nr:hypothetical protein [Gammaproteobacteria bacterium]